MSIKARIIDLMILGPLVAELVYVPYLLFFALRSDGAWGALGAVANNLSFEAMTIRRLYAFEYYFAMIGLILYLAFRKRILQELSEK